MKRAIAMRCNKEQWDAIKSKLVGLLLYSTPGFDSFPYLVNNCGGDLGVINNFSSKNKRDYNREVHENWNEQVFLEACGIETEKIFKGSELQFRASDEIKWESFSDYFEIRFKPDNSAEIAELERQIQILKNK